MTACAGNHDKRGSRRLLTGPGALTQRLAEQVEVLDRAAALVKPGGRIGYITCSVLAEEGPDQVAAFLGRHPGFRSEPAPFDQPSARLSSLRMSFLSVRSLR